MVDKNPLGLHQTEIIAHLAVDLRDTSERIINPLTNEPIRVKIGTINSIFILIEKKT